MQHDSKNSQFPYPLGTISKSVIVHLGWVVSCLAYLWLYDVIPILPFFIGGFWFLFLIVAAYSSFVRRSEYRKSSTLYFSTSADNYWRGCLVLGGFLVLVSLLLHYFLSEITWMNWVFSGGFVIAFFINAAFYELTNKIEVNDGVLSISGNDMNTSLSEIRSIEIHINQVVFISDQTTVKRDKLDLSIRQAKRIEDFLKEKLTDPALGITNHVRN